MMHNKKFRYQNGILGLFVNHRASWSVVVVSVLVYADITTGIAIVIVNRFSFLLYSAISLHL